MATVSPEALLLDTYLPRSTSMIDLSGILSERLSAGSIGQSAVWATPACARRARSCTSLTPDLRVRRFAQRAKRLKSSPMRGPMAPS